MKLSAIQVGLCQVVCVCCAAGSEPCGCMGRGGPSHIHGGRPQALPAHQVSLDALCSI